MRSKLVQNLSVNALQLVFNQLFGLVIFYLLSKGLDKGDFGRINLALAILLAAFNILSLGIDQLIIKRIAAGANIQNTLSLYIFHVLLTGISFYGLLWLGGLLFPHTDTYNLILFIGAGKLLIFFSAPFKQIANGMERFKLLAYMSVGSNLVRCTCLLVFTFLHWITIQTVVIIFVAGDLAELLVCILLFKQGIKARLSVKWDKVNYMKLLAEALPQTGVVMITSALARFDWIFIGFILSAVKLAEYSFAYKIFEVATLPLLAIAPLLIPLFTRLFQQQKADPEALRFLIRIEIIIAAFAALVLNVCWGPVIDWLTAGKYGAVNVTTIFILSLCMPLLYVNNFLWTIHFTQGRLRMILTSFVITLVVNIAGDIILIPFYRNEGAAFAFLLSCLAQTIYYQQKNEIKRLNIIWPALLICTGCALASGFAVNYFLINTWLALPLSVLFYVVLLLVMAQTGRGDGEKLRRFLKG